MELLPSLTLLAEQTRSGVAFVTAYGLTWLICGAFWHRASARTAAFATLFQGMVAFPLALGGSALIGAIGQGRPVADEITQLSVLIGASQLLGLPFLIFLVVKHWYTLVPVAFATLTSMHFVLYSWLYRTPVYIVLAVAVAVGAVIVTLTAPQSVRSTHGGEQPEPREVPAAGAARVCILTGGLLLATAATLSTLHTFG